MKKIKKDWVNFENYIANIVNGKRQPGSGNGPIQKGDVRAERFLIECKYTSKDSYALSASTWEKISDEALNLSLTPLFACRSKAGDFFIGRTLDFDENLHDYEEVNVVGSVIIEKPVFINLKGRRITHNLICWKIEEDEDNLISYIED